MPEAILTVGQMREREEQTWATGVAMESVIRRAGIAVAKAALRQTRTDDPVLVLAGRGHNGDDATIAEQHLGDRDTELARIREPADFEGAREWLRQQQGHPRALVIDGLFGIGLNRPLDRDWQEVIEFINASGVRILAVDAPSGLNADTGEPMGAAIRATTTITLGAVKAGLIKQSAAEYVGRLELEHDIGLVPSTISDGPVWGVASDFLTFPPARLDSSHKGSFGHVAVLAGSLGYHGAAVLAAEGALKARPGLVTVFVDDRCYVPVASQLRAAMVRPWRGETIDMEEFTAFVIGPGMASPGLSPAVREEVNRLWETAPGAVVVDASALDWLAAGHRKTAKGWRVTTPHPGEAARLLETGTSEIQEDRFGTALRLHDRYGGSKGIVVLKGRQTVIADEGRSPWVNPTGNPGLAQGGTGDVLAGFLGGLLAQPRLIQDPVKSVRYGVWRHGAAADALEASGRAWTTEDLVESLAAPL